MYRISNDHITLCLDDGANLVELSNLKTGKGNVIARPAPLFRAVLHNGENWEDLARAKDAVLTVKAEKECLTVEVEKLHTNMGAQEIRMTLTIRLDGEKVLFGARIDNRSQTTLNDFYYPCIGAVRTLGNGKPGLLYPDCFGEYHTDITEEQYSNRMILREAMTEHGFKPLPEEWWHFTLENEPYPDTYFTFPVNSEVLQ